METKYPKLLTSGIKNLFTGKIKYNLKGCMNFSIITLVTVTTLNGNVAHAEDKIDLTELPIENLLNMEVYSASKFIQKKSDAPTAVTVITAQNIKDYGYRTVADIVQSVRGLYIDSDRNYSNVGTRGFSIPVSP
jgi:outer membrane receptor for ferrienterochelin and colicin